MFKARERKKRFGHGSMKAEEFGRSVTHRKKSSKIRVIRRWAFLFFAIFLCLKMIYNMGEKNKQALVGDAGNPLHGPIVVNDSFYEPRIIPVPENAQSFKNLTPRAARTVNIAPLAVDSAYGQKLQLETVEKFKLALEVENSLGMVFRLIPPGNFMMGSPTDEIGRVPDEGEFELVELQTMQKITNPFYVGVYEVTQAQWKKVMGTNPSSYKGPNRPVEKVTWYDVIKFCQKLEDIEGVPRGTYRMLTEAEWEYSCRAATEGRFYFPDSAPDYGKFMVYKQNNNTQTAVVGGKYPNAWGLYNMHGNVMEWVHDYYRSYYDGSKYEGNRRVARGGSFVSELKFCRSAQRFRMGPTSEGNVLGFRIARFLHLEWEQGDTVQPEDDASDNLGEAIND